MSCERASDNLKLFNYL